MLDHQVKTRWQPLASSFSRAFSPAVALTTVVVAAGFKGGLSLWGVAVLFMGVGVLPAVTYKVSGRIFERYALPDKWRAHLLAVLFWVAALVCMVLQMSAPITETVVALFAGNVALLVLRRWLDVSGHVSVLTFAVLWVWAVFGAAWAWLLVLSPLMVLSRVKLREHSLGEAIIGALLGVATFGCFLGATTWSLIK